MGGYLFTDIDGSTERWERAPSQMADAVALHNRIIDELVVRHGGVIKDRAGDGVLATFAGGNPLECALEIQLALQRQDWSSVGALAVRVGVHADDEASALSRQIAINRAWRITESSWGGQITLSTAAVNAFSLPSGSWLSDLGFCRLKGIDEPLRLFSLAHRDMQRTDFPPPPTSVQNASAVIGFSTPMFGRERECEELMMLLESQHSRALSLVGPGGNGKTRLAAKLGAIVHERWPVWFVPLETVSDGSELMAAIARALRFPLQGVAPAIEQLKGYLAEKRGLLILDNVDDVALEAASFIASMRAGRNFLRVLTTSRAPLPTADAAVYRVAGLPIPGASDLELVESSAFKLFAHEVGMACPGLTLDKVEYHAFRDLCGLLRGSPLALRLAAQWRRVLPLSEIVARVRDDLDFLETNDADPADRHRSIRRVFEGSWATLSERDRGGLMRLAVFAGDFDAIGAEQGGGLELGALLALEQKGLIERTGGDRFTLHPLIKGYARERLTASAVSEHEARSLHADYYLGVVVTAFANAASDNHYAAIACIERENANILAAWRHTLEHQQWKEIEEAIEPLFYALVLRARYGDAIAYFKIRTGHEPTEAYLSALCANCLVQLGDLDEATSAANAALALGGDVAARAHANQALGLVAHACGDTDNAFVHYQAALEARRARADSLGCFYSNASLAILHIQSGDYERARQRIKETFHLCERTMNKTGLMIVNSLAADLAAAEGRLEDAKAGYLRSVELEQSVHHPQHRARMLTKLGGVTAAMGERASAIRYHQEALACAIQTGDLRHKIEALLAIGSDLRKQDQPDKAKIRLVQAMRLALKFGAPPFLIRCLLGIAEIEADMGNVERAQRLASVLARADLGQSEPGYRALIARLPAFAAERSENTSPEALVSELVNEADLAPLRL
ncbi:MAG: tetratricopeptide repeat protein [Hyphomonadaceae bacterium]